jgi:DNA-binding NarL/FixJ family response regulator
LLGAAAAVDEHAVADRTAPTASERPVVRLVVEGRSNPEIAQALYVSVKTVETHLSSAYRKLDLSGPGARRRLGERVAAAA